VKKYWYLIKEMFLLRKRLTKLLKIQTLLINEGQICLSRTDTTGAKLILQVSDNIKEHLDKIKKDYEILMEENGIKYKSI
jgi:hypothetical protein